MKSGFLWIKQLTEGFKLAQQNADINFNTVTSEGTTIDIAQNGKDDYVPVRKNNNAALGKLRQYFVDLSAEKKKEQLTGALSKEITNDHRLDGILQKDIERYIANAVASYDGDDILYLWDNLYQTKNVVMDKILGLLDLHREALFNKWLETDRIEPRGHYTFIENVTFAKQELVGIDKGLYAKEETVNSFEQKVIQAVADLDNVLFWHRNPERGGGFHINGFINHYPDFIVRMRSGKTVMIETKGDHLDNADTQKKIRLGNKWAAQCGSKFKYFMVFENKETEGAYTFSQLIDYLKEL